MNDEPVEKVLALLDNVKKHGSRYMAECPAHVDNKASLQISRGDDDRVLLVCFAGCENETIVSRLGLNMSDLFAKDKEKEQAKVTATYTYRDKDGSMLYQVLRKSDKEFPQRKPDGNGGWIYSLGDTKRVLYRLPELLQADNRRVVFVVEGEKDVERLTDLGLLATTSPGGAGKWRDEYAYDLHGRNVVIIPDNDEAGYKHARQAADSLDGLAASVKIAQLPNLPPKGDVSDWLDMGNTKEELKELVKQAPEYDSTVDSKMSEPQEAQQAEEPHRWTPKPLSTLVAQTESIEWLWEGYIAKGYITLLSSIWKAGKSTLLSYVLKYMDGQHHEFVGLRTRPANVLVVSEEVVRHWITRRDELELGDYVSLISKPFLQKPNKAAWESLCKHLGAEVALHQYDFVVFDTLPNLWAVKNENDNAEVQEALVPLNYIIEQGAGVVIVSHHKKNDGKNQHYDEGQATRGAGSINGYVDIIVEMRRYDLQHISDTRRVLTTLSRFEETPAEMVLDYTPGFGYASLGTKQEARREQRKLVLSEMLPTEGEGMSVDEIVKEWPEEIETPRRSTLASDLDYMAVVSMEVVRRGSGKKNEPYRYRRNNTERRYVALREDIA